MDIRNTVICEGCLRKQYPQKDETEWRAFLERQFEAIKKARTRHEEVVHARRNMLGIE